MACLFVSSKVEDTIKKLKDIMMATYHYRHPNVVDWDPESKEGEEQRRRVLSYEKMVLESICFDFHIVHPYKYIVKFVKLYDGHVDVAQRAWQIASDCYKIGTCLELPPHTIAAGSIYLASRLLGEPFPELIRGKPWCEAFNCRSIDVEDFCHQIIDQLYLRDLDSTEAEQKQYTAILIELNEARSNDDEHGHRAKRARLTYDRPTNVTAELERIEDGGTSNPTVRYLVGGRIAATTLGDECCGRSVLENEQARLAREQHPRQQHHRASSNDALPFAMAAATTTLTTPATVAATAAAPFTSAGSIQLTGGADQANQP
ncbi:RNA polymerase II C-terminal domain kinase beta subunit [Actinomortierella ambigua]|nr:RNA polymerase II C-terminal domain kinase beta subunit [Actinomortierella ambigua]